MDIKAFIYHKRSEKYCDCQDCFGIDTQNNRIAVSDGMSQSIFQQLWAKILVDAFLNTGKIPNNDIISYQQEWQKKVREEITRQEAEGINPWLLKDMFAERTGAGATLCGFSWHESGWECQCLGDTCLIKIRKDYSIEIVTSQDGKFDNYPDFLDSFCIGRGTPVTEKGDFDLRAILIVTDPFSELFQVHQKETEFIKERCKEIQNLSDHESFVSLVESWRDKYSLHNDDSTLVFLNNFHSENERILCCDSLVDLCNEEQRASKQEQQERSEETDETNGMETAKTEFLQSVIGLLKHYKGKKSNGKIVDWFNVFLKPIIRDFLKK